jgi:hypothetical protein
MPPAGTLKLKIWFRPGDINPGPNVSEPSLRSRVKHCLNDTNPARGHPDRQPSEKEPKRVNPHEGIARKSGLARRVPADGNTYSVCLNHVFPRSLSG